MRFLIAAVAVLALAGCERERFPVPATVNCQFRDGQNMSFQATDAFTLDNYLLIYLHGDRNSVATYDVVLKVKPITQCIVVPTGDTPR